jgi:hypothetical protein
MGGRPGPRGGGGPAFAPGKGKGPGHGHGHGHGHHWRGRGRGRGGWGWPGYNYGYAYWPSDVYYVGDVFTVEAYNAGRAEMLGQGVSWSAAMIGAQAYMQNSPPFAADAYVRIVPGYSGASVCEWRGGPGGWEQIFCDPYSAGGYYGVGSDQTPPPSTEDKGKGGVIALAILGAVTVGALGWMAFGAKKGSRYGFAA